VAPPSEASAGCQQQRHRLRSSWGRRCCERILGFLDRCHHPHLPLATPEKGIKSNQVSSRSKIGRGVRERRENKSHVQPDAPANAINHTNANSCRSRAPSIPPTTSASLVHAAAVAGAVAEVPSIAPSLCGRGTHHFQPSSRVNPHRPAHPLRDRVYQVRDPVWCDRATCA
jgi:hypothetical protein